MKFSDVLKKLLPEDFVSTSDIASFKDVVGVRNKVEKDIKKNNKIYRICDKCMGMIQKSRGRYPKKCPNCGDVVNSKDIEVTEKCNKKHKMMDSEYEKIFKSALKKYGVSEPDQLDDKKKKEFYNYVDKNWKAKKETD